MPRRRGTHSIMLSKLNVLKTCIVLGSLELSYFAAVHTCGDCHTCRVLVHEANWRSAVRLCTAARSQIFRRTPGAMRTMKDYENTAQLHTSLCSFLKTCKDPIMRSCNGVSARLATEQLAGLFPRIQYHITSQHYCQTLLADFVGGPPCVKATGRDRPAC